MSSAPQHDAQQQQQIPKAGMELLSSLSQDQIGALLRILQGQPSASSAGASSDTSKTLSHGHESQTSASTLKENTNNLESQLGIGEDSYRELYETFPPPPLDFSDDISDEDMQPAADVLPATTTLQNTPLHENEDHEKPEEIFDDSSGDEALQSAQPRIDDISSDREESGDDVNEIDSELEDDDCDGEGEDAFSDVPEEIDCDDDRDETFVPPQLPTTAPDPPDEDFDEEQPGSEDDVSQCSDEHDSDDEKAPKKIDWRVDPRKAIIRRRMGISADVEPKHQDQASRAFNAKAKRVCGLDLSITWDEHLAAGRTEAAIDKIMQAMKKQNWSRTLCINVLKQCINNRRKYLFRLEHEKKRASDKTYVPPKGRAARTRLSAASSQHVNEGDLNFKAVDDIEEEEPLVPIKKTKLTTPTSKAASKGLNISRAEKRRSGKAKANVDKTSAPKPSGSTSAAASDVDKASISKPAVSTSGTASNSTKSTSPIPIPPQRQPSVSPHVQPLPQVPEPRPMVSTPYRYTVCAGNFLMPITSEATFLDFKECANFCFNAGLPQDESDLTTWTYCYPMITPSLLEVYGNISNSADYEAFLVRLGNRQVKQAGNIVNLQRFAQEAALPKPPNPRPPFPPPMSPGPISMAPCFAPLEPRPESILTPGPSQTPGRQKIKSIATPMATGQKRKRPTDEVLAPASTTQIPATPSPTPIQSAAKLAMDNLGATKKPSPTNGPASNQVIMSSQPMERSLIGDGNVEEPVQPQRKSTRARKTTAKMKEALKDPESGVPRAAVKTTNRGRPTKAKAASQSAGRRPGLGV